MSGSSYTVMLPTEESMLSFGSQLAAACGKTAVIFLYGPLGAGKTTLSRGFLRGLGYAGHVKSPTYTLVEPYDTHARTVYHFDLYRVKDPAELEYMGIQDYFRPDTICLIEWPEHGLGVLPQADLSCYIELQGRGRKFDVKAHSAQGETILRALQNDK